MGCQGGHQGGGEKYEFEPEVFGGRKRTDFRRAAGTRKRATEVLESLASISAMSGKCAMPKMPSMRD